MVNEVFLQVNLDWRLAGSLQATRPARVDARCLQVVGTFVIICVEVAAVRKEMLALCSRIVRRPSGILRASRKVGLPMSTMSSKPKWTSPPRPPQIPKLPSLPNWIEGELRYHYEKLETLHGCLQESCKSWELDLRCEPVDINCLSIEQLVTFKTKILPDFVAYAEAAGVTVSPSLLQEVTFFAKCKALVWVGPVKIVAIASEPHSLGLAATFVASPFLGGAVALGAGDAIAVAQADAFIAAFEAAYASAAAAAKSAALAAAAVESGLWGAACMTETAAVGLAEAGLLGGLWKITLPFRVASFAIKKKKEREALAAAERTEKELQNFWKALDEYKKARDKYLKDFDRYLNSVKAWDVAQRVYISYEVTYHYYW